MYLNKKLKYKKTINEYELDCKLIPSNMLKAFIKTMKQKQVKNWIIRKINCLLKRKFNIFIFKLSSRTNNPKIIIDTSDNFSVGDRFNLSSTNPIKKLRNMKLKIILSLFDFQINFI